MNLRQLARLLAGLIVISTVLNLAIGFVSYQIHASNTPEGVFLKNNLRNADESTQLIRYDGTEYSGAKVLHNRSVFFNVFVNNETGITFRYSIKIATEQLADLPNGTNVYYNIIGRNYRRNLCAGQNLHCKKLKYASSGNEEITLQPLWRYCHNNPEHRVTYIHNKGSFRRSTGNKHSRERATRGAISLECLKMPLSDGHPCNLCGTKFSFLPHMNYVANIWTAECSYVNQLEPPNTYTKKREDLLRRLFEKRPCLNHVADSGMDDVSSQWNLSDPLFLRNVGLGRYALERWVTNHPDMVPCDVWNGTITQMWKNSNLTLSVPRLRQVSKKMKARNTWLLEKEYEAFYPNASISRFLKGYQAFPEGKAC